MSMVCTVHTVAYTCKKFQPFAHTFHVLCTAIPVFNASITPFNKNIWCAPEHFFVYYRWFEYPLFYKYTGRGTWQSYSSWIHIPLSCCKHDCLCWSYEKINTLAQGQRRLQKSKTMKNSSYILKDTLHDQ